MSRKRGFSLIEVLVSASLFLVGLGGVFSAYGTAVELLSHTARRTIAMSLAEAMLEELVLRFPGDPYLDLGEHGAAVGTVERDLRGEGDSGKGDSGKGDSGKGDSGKGDSGKGDSGKGDSGKSDVDAKDTKDDESKSEAERPAEPLLTTVSFDERRSYSRVGVRVAPDHEEAFFRISWRVTEFIKDGRAVFPGSKQLDVTVTWPETAGDRSLALRTWRF